MTTLIGLTGRKRSGKDTVGGFLYGYGFDRVSFAGPIKRILEHMDPYLDGNRLMGSFSEGREMSRLVDSFAQAVREHTIIEDLDQNRRGRALDILDPFVTGSVRLGALLREAEGDWDQLKDEESNPFHREIRRLQQILGTEVGREILPGSVWVDTGMAEVARHRRDLASVVITDCRFDDEAEAVRAAGGKVVRVVRPSLPKPTDAHASESGISDHLVDREIVNDGTLDDLRVESLDLASWAAEQ